MEVVVLLALGHGTETRRWRAAVLEPLEAGGAVESGGGSPKAWTPLRAAVLWSPTPTCARVAEVTKQTGDERRPARPNRTEQAGGDVQNDQATVG